MSGQVRELALEPVVDEGQGRRLGKPQSLEDAEYLRQLGGTHAGAPDVARGRGRGFENVSRVVDDQQAWKVVEPVREKRLDGSNDIGADSLGEDDEGSAALVVEVLKRLCELLLPLFAAKKEGTKRLFQQLFLIAAVTAEESDALQGQALDRLQRRSILSSPRPVVHRVASHKLLKRRRTHSTVKERTLKLDRLRILQSL